MIKETPVTIQARSCFKLRYICTHSHARTHKNKHTSTQTIQTHKHTQRVICDGYMHVHRKLLWPMVPLTSRAVNLACSTYAFDFEAHFPFYFHKSQGYMRLLQNPECSGGIQDDRKWYAENILANHRGFAPGRKKFKEWHASQHNLCLVCSGRQPNGECLYFQQPRRRRNRLRNRSGEGEDT